MRLMTHNLLMCHVRGCDTDNYPLEIVDADLQLIEADYNAEFLKAMLYKIDWPVFVQTVQGLGLDGLPGTLPAPTEMTDEFLRRVHHILLETKVQQGRMVCKGCGHVFPIKDGIPNMLLNETEI